ncbi:MAG TPA: glycoside hydrolase family 15 protein [Chitinispirillaceae bacterium]|nr:glycoside hydrolase family 15 protein [Chitinispirillaceae bacterium]
MPNKIGDYGIIGDSKTCALVSRKGSIDWFCAPRFDSDACFAALLGTDENGRYSIRPAAEIRESNQKYLDNTLILETEYICDGGLAKVIDFMPFNEKRVDIIRIIEGLEGELDMEVIIQPRFSYGMSYPWIVADERGVTMSAGPDALRIVSSVPVKAHQARLETIIRVKRGDRIPISLTWFASHEPQPSPLDPERAFESTKEFWLDWTGKCTYDGRYKEEVMRSLITLKALTYEPTGAIVAAPTTSLPEESGGVRNWDYRYCWLRDASLTIQALMIGGYRTEAKKFRGWLERAVAGNGSELQIMYGISGERRLTEVELEWLPGYESSAPVRIGNDASRQFQLDVFGETLNSLYRSRQLGILEFGPDAGKRISSLMDFLDTAWQLPDDGIWEVRGGRRHFTHSKVMAWVAVDRAIRTLEKYDLPGGDEIKERLPYLRSLRARIHEDVISNGFNKKIGAFTQSYGSDVLDSSVLLIPHTGFLPADDYRMAGTVAAIERSLMKNGFVSRYSTSDGIDGLPGSEATFLMCTFWLADNYALSGRRREAEELFERLLSIRNHLGLLSEEYDPEQACLLGNFPQAFSHIGLIISAFVLSASTDEIRRRFD